MIRLRIFFHRLLGMFFKRRLDRDLDDEIRSHLEMQIEENVKQGMNANEAHFAAQRKFGGVVQVKEAYRERSGLPLVESILQDIRYAGRMWKKTPAFTLFAICGLALAIGANTAVFTIVNAVLYRNLPFRGSDRIVYLSSFDTAHGEAEPLETFSHPEYRDLREQLKSFDHLAAFRYGEALYTDDSNFPERYFAVRMTENTLSVFGRKPLRGRDLSPADTQPGAPPVVLLTYRIWENRYHKNESVIGKTVHIDEKEAIVIGVTAPDIWPVPDNDIWLPIVTPQAQPSRKERDLLLFGRLADGVDIGQANTEAAAVARQMSVEYPATNKTIGIEVLDYNKRFVRAQIRLVLQALLGGVAFVLLIACANVANLLLGRAVIRSREMSIRAALGAGRLRVIRQLLTESILLSVMAGALGCLLAYLGVKAFDAALAAMELAKPGSIVFSLDRNVLLYLVAISIGSGIVFGLAPAFRISRIDLNSALREGGQTSGTGVRRRLLAKILVGAEVALSVVLLMGAVLMIRSTVVAGKLNLGVNTANVMTMQIVLPQLKYKRPQEQLSFFQELSARIKALPGVEAATIVSNLPGNGSMLERMNPFQIEGSPIADESNRPRTTVLTIGPEYFRCMQAQMLRGREFTDLDGDSGHEAVIINQSFADRHWPGENPLGKRIRVDDRGRSAWSTIVGVSADIIQTRYSKGLPRVYLPYRQNPGLYMVVAARTRVDPVSLASAFRQSVGELNANLPVFALHSLEDVVLRSHADTRLFSFVFTVLAIIALSLASTGLYAVISQSVNQRTREMAIRTALGAGAHRLWWLMFSQGMWQFAIGLVIGLALSFVVSGVLSSLLVGVSASDPISYLLIVTVLALVAALACGLPARRAAQSDPAALLRFE